MTLESRFSSILDAARDTPPEGLPALLATLASAQAVVASRLVEARPSTGSRSLSVEEAAERLGVSASWLYKNASRLSFARRIGRRLVFDSEGAERWLRSRAA